MDGWNTIVSFFGAKRPIFRCKLAEGTAPQKFVSLHQSLPDQTDINQPMVRFGGLGSPFALDSWMIPENETLKWALGGG